MLSLHTRPNSVSSKGTSWNTTWFLECKYLIFWLFTYNLMQTVPHLRKTQVFVCPLPQSFSLFPFRTESVQNFSVVLHTVGTGFFFYKAFGNFFLSLSFSPPWLHKRITSEHTLLSRLHDTCTSHLHCVIHNVTECPSDFSLLITGDHMGWFS
jgi:hypothetical protein